MPVKTTEGKELYRSQINQVNQKVFTSHLKKINFSHEMRNPSHLNLYPMNRALLCYMILLGNQRRGLLSGEETEVELRWDNKIGRERTELLSACPYCYGRRAM